MLDGADRQLFTAAKEAKGAKAEMVELSDNLAPLDAPATSTSSPTTPGSRGCLFPRSQYGVTCSKIMLESSKIARYFGSVLTQIDNDLATALSTR
jgi:hypothetical protein